VVKAHAESRNRWRATCLHKVRGLALCDEALRGEDDPDNVVHVQANPFAERDERALRGRAMIADLLERVKHVGYNLVPAAEVHKCPAILQLFNTVDELKERYTTSAKPGVIKDPPRRSCGLGRLPSSKGSGRGSAKPKTKSNHQQEHQLELPLQQHQQAPPPNAAKTGNGSSSSSSSSSSSDPKRRRVHFEPQHQQQHQPKLQQHQQPQPEQEQAQEAPPLQSRRRRNPRTVFDC
jgi:hypothetical protein